MNKGKRQIFQSLNRRLFARVTLMQFIQAACYCAGVAALGAGILALLCCDLSLWQIILGLLASCVAPLFFFAFGVLLPSIAASQEGSAE